MKILIIGGGIGGFSMYHALRRHLSDTSPATTIKIFEAYPSASLTKSIIGGGLGLAPNGLRALAALSPDIAEDLQTRGFCEANITLRNSSGKFLGRVRNGRKERYGYDQMFLPRASVHDVVLKGVPDDVVEWQKKAREVRETEEGVEVEFEDGTVEKGDLVIGADGVRSKVREAIFGTKYQAEYDGMTGIGGFIPLAFLPEKFRKSLEQDPVTMTFGPHGFFGYALSSPRSEHTDKQQLMWWSTWETPTPPSRTAPLDDIRTQLLTHHSSWKTPHDTPEHPVFPTIVSLACGPQSTANPSSAAEKNVLVLPRYMTPRLPSWSSTSGRIIIMGDAAHAMPPDAGQGVSCAVEDAVVIALLLKHHFRILQHASSDDAKLGDALKNTARAYEDLRMGRLAFILDAAKRVGNTKRELKKWQEMLRDFFIPLLCKLPESINDRRFAYDAESEVKKYIAKKSRR